MSTVIGLVGGRSMIGAAIADSVDTPEPFPMSVNGEEIPTPLGAALVTGCVAGFQPRPPEERRLTDPWPSARERRPTVSR